MLSPTEEASSTEMTNTFEALTRRDYPCYVNGFRTTCRGGWYYWGRWVLAGLALLFFVLVLFSCCLTARRRRRRGHQPIYGTGWMAPPPKYGDHSDNQAYPMNNYAQQNAYGGPDQQPYGGGYAPPAYGQQPQYTGSTFNPNDGYYGGHNTGIASPPNTYQADHVYPPPPNPPPGMIK